MVKEYMNEKTAQRVIEEALHAHIEKYKDSTSLQIKPNKIKTSGITISFDDNTEFIVTVARVK